MEKHQDARGGSVPRRCGRGWSPHQASSDNTASLRSLSEESASRWQHIHSPTPSAHNHNTSAISSPVLVFKYRGREVPYQRGTEWLNPTLLFSCTFPWTFSKATAASRVRHRTSQSSFWSTFQKCKSLSELLVTQIQSLSKGVLPDSKLYLRSFLSSLFPNLGDQMVTFILLTAISACAYVLWAQESHCACVEWELAITDLIKQYCAGH